MSALPRAEQVAQAWAGSADEKVWRAGYYPLNTSEEWLPKDAFHGGADKFATGAGTWI